MRWYFACLETLDSPVGAGTDRA